MILILSNKWDLTIDFVIRKLRARNHEYLRLNTEELNNWCVSTCLPEFEIVVACDQRNYNLSSQVKVIWNRRPGKIFDEVPLQARPSQAIQDYINNQWYTWLEALQLIEKVKWVNHPRQNDLMENKILQLQKASQLGFKIPETIITNDPIKAKLFIESRGGKAIAKALYSPLIEEPDQDYFIFTNEVITSDLASTEEIKVSPIIFQNRLFPKMDYRVTVIGDQVFSAKVVNEDPDNKYIDWRTSKTGPVFQQSPLPIDIKNLCCQYIRQCNLHFGAIDLAYFHNDFIFLEVNPNGEWGWLQKPYNIPIAEALTDFLISQDKE